MSDLTTEQEAAVARAAGAVGRELGLAYARIAELEESLDAGLLEQIATLEQRLRESETRSLRHAGRSHELGGAMEAIVDIAGRVIGWHAIESRAWQKQGGTNA